LSYADFTINQNTRLTQTHVFFVRRINHCKDFKQHHKKGFQLNNCCQRLIKSLTKKIMVSLIVSNILNEKLAGFISLLGTVHIRIQQPFVSYYMHNLQSCG